MKHFPLWAAGVMAGCALHSAVHDDGKGYVVLTYVLASWLNHWTWTRRNATPKDQSLTGDTP